MRGRLFNLVIISLLVLSGFVMADDKPNSVTITGQGKITLPANQVTITFTIQCAGKSLDTAFARAHEQISSIGSDLEKLGLPGDILETSLFDNRDKKKKGGFISPQKKYKLTQTVSLTTDQVDLVEEILVALMARKVEQVLSIRFERTEEDSIKRAVVAAAVADARTKALAMADELGFELGATIEITEHGTPRYNHVQIPSGEIIVNGRQTSIPKYKEEFSLVSVVRVVFAVKKEEVAATSDE